ncbi:MAG: hypothetical protein LUC26_03605 [Prevotella sp.]|nr:hypothetical protein [Prevotella sp.]
MKLEYKTSDSDDTQHAYPWINSNGTTEIDFATDYPGITEITCLSIYDTHSSGDDPETASIVIEEAYLIKAATEEGGDPTEEQIVYGGNYWGSTYVSYSPEITYSQQNAEISLANADGTAFSLAQGSQDTYNFTITLAEPAPIEILLKSEFDSGSDGYPGSIAIGGTSCTFTLDANTVAERGLSYIGLMANTSETATTAEEGDEGDEGDEGEETTSIYPAVVKFASIVATVTGDDIKGDFDNYFTLPKNVCTSDHSLLDTGTNFTTESGTENTYVADDRTITFGSSYAGYGWWLGGYDETTGEGEEQVKTGNRLNVEDYSIYQGIEVAFKTTATSDELIQLVVEYFRDEDCTEGDIVTSAAYTLGTGDGENFGTGQTLYIDFSKTYASHMYQIYIQNGNSSGTKIQLLGARLIPKSNDDEEYSYKMNLAGYATSNWNSSKDEITINELDGDDFLGTADLTFTSGYSDETATIGLGWHDWGNTGDGAFNLAQFDEVRISYQVTSKETEDNVTVQALFNNTNYSGEEGTNVNIVQKDSNEDGIITLTIAAGSYQDDSGKEVDDFDWTHVGQFVIQASAACTVKITSIEFYRGVRTAPDVQTIDVSTSNDNIIISRTGGTIYVEGDGSSTGYTFSFPLNATGTYDIYIADGTKIDTKVGDSNLNAGITIPRGVTVNLYFDGESSVSGSTYGIYANYGSTLHIYTYAEQSSSSEQATETTSKTTDLTINGDYGIWFYGSSLKIDGVTEEWKTNYNIYSYTTQNRGQITINSKYCGIYFGPETTGTVIEGCNVSIYISGSADDLENATDNYVDGVSGIYNDCASGSQINFQAMDLTIWAPEDGTYGFFSNVTNGNGIWFGAGTYVIKATKCVLHHPDGTQYSGGYGYLQGYDADSKVTLQLIGPFCLHYEGPYYYNNQYNWNIWSCDGGEGTLSADTENGDPDGDLDGGYSTLPSNANYQADDQYDYDSSYATIYSVTEMEYFNRTLYKGWNTLSLPCDYDLSSTTEEDTDYEGVEARKVITQVATFGSIISADDYESQYGSTEEGDSNGAKKISTLSEEEENGDSNNTDDSTNDTPTFDYYLTFTSVDTTTNPVLSAGTAYLVYVADPMAGSTSEASAEDSEDESTTSYADQWKVLTHFTSMSKDLKHVNDDKGEGLKTVYHAETMKADGEISGDSNTEDTYYYKLYNPAQEEKEGDAYFNRPLTTAKVGGFRAYLDASSIGEDGGDVKSLSIVFDDGTTTSIEELDGGVNAENSRVRVYSIDGKLIKVAGASEATKGLARGVYVVDGKKVVVM